jgi:hypothetical protein
VLTVAELALRLESLTTPTAAAARVMAMNDDYAEEVESTGRRPD